MQIPLGTHRLCLACMSKSCRWSNSKHVDVEAVSSNEHAVQTALGHRSPLPERTCILMPVCWMHAHPPLSSSVSSTPAPSLSIISLMIAHINTVCAYVYVM